MNTSSNRCVVCGAPEGRVHVVREMMFGTGALHHYFECSNCGCLQLRDPPSDMTAHYPPGYYSYHSDEALPGTRLRRNIRDRLSAWRNESQLLGVGCIGRCVARVRPRADVASLRSLFKPTPVRSFSARILDVGCGAGDLVRRLWRIGFRNVVGIDPFLAADLVDTDSLRIISVELGALAEEQFDLIMFHHSLEHMQDHGDVMQQVARMLAPGGVCLIRIPVAASEPWLEYQENWVELDAPRHFIIHTPGSLNLLLAGASLECFYSEYDSTSFAYWGSELYQRNVSLIDPDSGRFRDPLTLFSATELNGWQQRAEDANRRHSGGRAAFYVRAAPRR